MFLMLWETPQKLPPKALLLDLRHLLPSSFSVLIWMKWHPLLMNLLSRCLFHFSTSFVNFPRYLQLINEFQVDIAIPEVFVGGLLGSMLIFLFSAWACSAVGRTAQEVVNEVRRQFIERPGIMVSMRSL